jgi:hypothetical protein
MSLDLDSSSILPEKLNYIEIMSAYARFSNEVTLILDLLDQGITAYNGKHVPADVHEAQYMQITANLYSELEQKLRDMWNIYAGFVSNWNELLNADEDQGFVLSRVHYQLKENFEVVAARAKANRIALKTSKGEFNATGFNHITSQIIALTRLLNANIKTFGSLLSETDTVMVVDAQKAEEI